ncbi:hypothetical protein LCGC14_1161580 [marine sediment metagenome]|uniref:Uncharacterized protein n=1 Tax=marine sediment metagenome TaxID=412755 RepID=A0A0F9LXG9_9ZZZZ
MALELFEKSLAILIQLSNKPKQSVRFDWIGTIYNILNRKDEALNSIESYIRDPLLSLVSPDQIKSCIIDAQNL